MNKCARYLFIWSPNLHFCQIIRLALWCMAKISMKTIIKIACRMDNQWFIVNDLFLLYILIIFYNFTCLSISHMCIDIPQFTKLTKILKPIHGVKICKIKTHFSHNSNMKISDKFWDYRKLLLVYLMMLKHLKNILNKYNIIYYNIIMCIIYY